MVKTRLVRVHDFALESRMIRAKMTVSEYVRAVLVAHLGLQKQENQGVVHSVTHPSFDRAVKRFNLAYEWPVRTEQGRYRKLICRALVLLLAA
jgi:hypothetical protein